MNNTTNTTETARQQISQMLAEDFGHGVDFDSISHKLPAAIKEAIEFDDEWVTVKVPSHSEFMVSLEVAKAAVR